MSICLLMEVINRYQTKMYIKINRMTHTEKFSEQPTWNLHAIPNNQTEIKQAWQIGSRVSLSFPPKIQWKFKLRKIKEKLISFLVGPTTFQRSLVYN